MQVNEGTYEGLTWEGKYVEIADIERELDRLWCEALAVAEEHQMPVRSSVLNLVVHTSSDADAEQLYETVGRLSSRHPLRAIILSVEPHHQEPSLHTTMRVRCSEDPNTGSKVCCEQVLVEANGEPAKHLRGVVLPLLIPDLPRYLWWMGEPEYDSATFESLITAADKFILDSNSFRPSPATLREALHMSKVSGRVCAVNDVNWIRLWRWLEAVAQLFDDSALHPHLAGIERVRVEYAARPGCEASPAQAALLAGWLFSRLGPKPSASVELVPVEAPRVFQGGVVSFEMQTRRASETATFEVSADKEGEASAAVARVRVNGEARSERPVMVAPRTDAEALDIALEDCQRDISYEEALEIAAQILERETAQ